MVNVNINGVSYQIPNTGEEGWGDNVTNWIVAASSFLLQRSGGSFPLSAEVDLGAVAGLRALIYRSQASDVAASGVLRLGNADKISFRNATNSADLQLGLSTDTLQFNGISLIQAGLGSIVNADVNAVAAIALSKLAAVTASRALVSDGSGVISPSAVTDTELSYVGGVTSSIQSQINALIVGAGINQLTGDVTAGPGSGSQAATITTGAVTNAKVSNSAAIAYSKLALSASVKAADMDSQAAANGSVLTANGSGGASYVAPATPVLVSANTAVASTVNGTPTVVVFGIEVFDTANIYNPATGELTIGTSGFYSIEGNVSLAGTSAEQDVQVSINVNGTPVARVREPNFLNGSSYNPKCTFSFLLQLTATNVVTVLADVAGGSTLDTNTPARTYLNVVKVG